MSERLQTLIFVALVALLSLAGLVWVYAVPPASLQVSRAGVPFFTPRVQHPVTGEALDLDRLVDHFKGVKR